MMVSERRAKRFGAAVGLTAAAMWVFSGCGFTVTPPPPPPPGGGGTPSDQALNDADTVRGGSLYDKFWKVQGVTAAEPTRDHPLWASRPDKTSNTRTGADTWRCKECHGWDYKGKDGAYASGGHRTGIAGIINTTMSGDGIFNLLKNDHAYGGAGLSDADIWDLTKFVLEGLIDTDAFIDTSGAFTGNVNTGQTLYDSGIGTNTACMVCHGADGLTIDFGEGEFVGTVASDNPWEFQHKVRFGNPGAAMPAGFSVNVTNDELADLGAFAQTLPTVAGGGGTPSDQALNDADTVRGGSLYDKFWKVQGVTAAEPTTDHPLWASRPDKTSNTRTGADTWRCKECHGWDYKGVDGAYASGGHKTGIAGIINTTMSGDAIFELLKHDHAYGDAGLTDTDIWDLTKFVLEGLIDTDAFIDTSGAFTGDVNTGQTLFDSGIGTNLACMICHGTDGLTIDFGGGEFVGTVASDNPWEFQHKVRFGNPGSPMPAGFSVNVTNDELADVGAFAQTLPTAAP